MKKKYKITEAFPQSTVKLIHYIEVEDKEELEEAKDNPGDFAYKTETDIDFGDSAHTESIEEIEGEKEKEE